MAKHFVLGGRVLSNMQISLRTLRDDKFDDDAASEVVLGVGLGAVFVESMCDAELAVLASRAKRTPGLSFHEAGALCRAAAAIGCFDEVVFCRPMMRRA